LLLSLRQMKAAKDARPIEEVTLCQCLLCGSTKSCG
jgi:hypothetical protein